MIITGSCQQALSFSCPALAWQNARARGVHGSRLRRRGNVPLAPPAVLSPSVASRPPDSGIVSEQWESVAESVVSSQGGDNAESEAEWELVG